MAKDFLDKYVIASEQMILMHSKHVKYIREMQGELNEKKKTLNQLVDEGNSIDEKTPSEIIGVFETLVKKLETAIDEEAFAIQTIVGNVYKKSLQNGFITKSLFQNILEIQKTLLQDCPLHLAILNNDYDKFATLCKDTKELSRKDVWGRNALQIAVMCSPKFCIKDGMNVIDNMLFHESENISHSNALRMIQLLLTLELDPDATDNLLKWNTIEQAIALNAFSALHLLCQQLTNYSIKFDRDFCLYVNASLFGACRSFMEFTHLDSEYTSTILEFMKKYESDHVGICEHLKNIKSRPDSKFFRDDFDNTLLHQAAMKGRSDFVRFFILTGSELEDNNSKGETALHLACAHDQVECVKVLLLHHANTSAVDKKEQTPLHNAVNNVNILNILLNDDNKDIAKMDVNGWTALHLAIKKSNYESVKLLVERGSDINELTDRKLSTLHIASKSNNFKVFEYILNNVKERDTLDYDGLTPLAHAMQNSYFEYAKLLIDDGASVNVKDEQQNTPLHLASMKGQIVLLKQLIEKEANLNAPNKKGQTALHLAVEKNSINCVRTLLRNGANVNCVDGFGNTPLKLACNVGYPMANLLICNGGKSDDANLCNAIENNNLDLVDLLVSNGAVANSALCYAKINNHMKAIKFLVELGTVSLCKYPQCLVCRKQTSLPNIFAIPLSTFGTN